MHPTTVLLLALAATVASDVLDSALAREKGPVPDCDTVLVPRDPSGGIMAFQPNIVFAAGTSTPLLPPLVPPPMETLVASSTLPLPPIVQPPTEILAGTPTLALPPVVPPPMETLGAQSQAAAVSHDERKVQSALPKLTTDLFSETLRNLPKPGPMPTTSVHYNAAWTSSVSSEIDAAVKKARMSTSKSPEQKLREEELSLIASVTSAGAASKSASIVSSSASSVEVVEAFEKARQAKALKDATHKLNKWYKKHDMHKTLSNAVPIVQPPALLFGIMGLMAAFPAL